MKIAAVQAAPIFMDTSATTDKLLVLLREAASNGAELIVFPEVFLPGYPIWLRAPDIAHNDELLEIGHIAYLKSAIAIDGPEIEAIVAEATTLGVAVYLGVAERASSGGSVYASLVTIHPNKGVINVHRKMKPTFHERLLWADGDAHGLQVHQWKDINIGGLNCFENWQPLARQALYEQGEQLHVATWPGDLDVTDKITQFIALEGRMYVTSVSGVLRSSDIPSSFPLKKYITKGRDLINNGGSMIVAPDGSALAGAVVGEETILYAEVLVDTVIGARMKLDPAGHYARPELLRLERNRYRRD